LISTSARRLVCGFAFQRTVLPLQLQSIRHERSVTIIGGLIASQLLTVYTTPVVYLYFDQAQQWRSRTSETGSLRRGL